MVPSNRETAQILDKLHRNAWIIIKIGCILLMFLMMAYHEAETLNKKCF